MKPYFLFAALAVAAVAGTALYGRSSSPLPPSGGRVGVDPGMVKEGRDLHPRAGDQLAAFSGGCFWGVEDGFRQVKGVVATAVGYTGGHTANPTYEDVCTHTTGHAETVLVEFDPKKISYSKLVDEFWEMHDPTTKDRQGPDVGDSYRSAIWTFSPAQLTEAKASLHGRQKKESAPIVTEIHPVGAFYLAEDYHQQYAERTGTHGCPIRHRSKTHAWSESVDF